MTGVAIFVRSLVLRLNNQSIKEGNGHRFFVMINWTKAGNV